MLSIKNVNKYFNRHKSNQIHVINNTTIDFGDKGLVSLLGPSGCGKTTLLNVISGLDKWSSGKIYINNKRVRYKKLEKLRNMKIGYIFQDYKIVDDMTVYENVAVSLKMCGLKDKKQIEERVFYVLKQLDMFRYRNRKAAMLSGGERQRVGIARAIVKDPDIVICDEPTGNLDSKNSVEIMNIIKKVSEKKLVILVTHEDNLAKFYSDRIIRIEDGKVISDEANTPSENLDYELDNKIYLKDFKHINKFKKDGININYYSDEEEERNINVVYKNGNLYISTDNINNIESINESSKYELVDDHYKKLDKSVYEKYEFNLEPINKKNRSVISLFKSVLVGFKKVLNYKKIKKVLSLSYIVTSIFILLCVSISIGVKKVYKEEYANTHDSFIEVKNLKNSLDVYNSLINLDSVYNVIPTIPNEFLTIKMNDYIQTNKLSVDMEPNIVLLSTLSPDEIVEGRMPENDYEIVIDKLLFERINNNGINNSTYSVGIRNPSGLIGKKVQYRDKEFTIVGLTDNVSPMLYISDNVLTLFMGYRQLGEYRIDDYSLYQNDITILSGRAPLNDYEILLPNTYKQFMHLNQLLDVKVNKHKLKVVGFYDDTNNDFAYINSKTFKECYIKDVNAFIVSSKDKSKTMQELKEIKYITSTTDIMEKQKNEYIFDRKVTVQAYEVVTLVLLVITFVEMYLMSRSSFLSRIREVGIFRAIGIKKWDIYKMFMGEILAISILYSLSGIIISSFLIDALLEINVFKTTFELNIEIIVLTTLAIFIYNLVVGLIPVFNLMRKTPAQILSRKDI